MEISKVHIITFSPTHTSERIARAIAGGTGIADMTCTNLTLPGAKATAVEATGLAVITAPVYGGFVAPTALERMKDICGNGTPAIVGVVYGNRDYEKALEELAAFVTAKGFMVIAAGTFIGEHSYSNETYRIAAGRPDTNDLEFAADLGKKVKNKVEAMPEGVMPPPIDVSKISRPRQPQQPLMNFISEVAKLRQGGMPMPAAPVTDDKLCNHCGRCAAYCPTGAITKGNELVTDAAKCIRCCACVKACPQKARTYDTPFAALLAENFHAAKENQMII